MKAITWIRNRGVIIIAFLLFVFLFIIAGVGIAASNDIKDRTLRCTETTLAYCVDSGQNEYLVAPFHGGRVTKDYEYWAYYEVPIGDNLVKIKLFSYSPIDTGSLIDVYYNPENIDEWFIDLREMPHVMCTSHGNHTLNDINYGYVDNL